MSSSLPKRWRRSLIAAVRADNARRRWRRRAIASYAGMTRMTWRRPWYSSQTPLIASLSIRSRRTPADIMHQEFRGHNDGRVAAHVAGTRRKLGSLRAPLAADRRRPAPCPTRQLEELFWYVREKESYGTGRPPLADAVLDLIVAARQRFINLALHGKASDTSSQISTAITASSEALH